MGRMFFRRKSPIVPTYPERVESLKRAGFTVTPRAGGIRICRGDCAVDVVEADGAARIQDRAGVLLGGEIGALVDGGFQKFFRAPGGTRKPATAGELKDLHDFESDLKEGLGQTSLYNESLGTVSTFYQYDRVQDRDRGAPKRVWE